MLTATLRVVDGRKLGWAVLGERGTLRDDSGAFVPFDASLVRPMAPAAPGGPLARLQEAAIPAARWALPVALFDLSGPAPELVDVVALAFDEPGPVRGAHAVVNVHAAGSTAGAK